MEVGLGTSIHPLVPRESATELLMRRKAEAARAPSSKGQSVIDRSSRLYETCVEFEAIFLKQMLNAMRKTVPRDGLLDGGMAQDVFEDMLYDEYSKSMARSAGFGLADTVYLHLTSEQARAVGADSEG